MSKVLIVDDEEDIRTLLSGFFKKDGIDLIIEAANGKEAIEMVGKEAPDVILIDFNMPVMNGLETCRVLKQDEKTGNIPILMMTSIEESKSEAVNAGVDDFVYKPFDFREVSLRVKAMLKVKDYPDQLQRICAYAGELAKKLKKREVDD